MSWQEYFSNAMRLINRKVTSKEMVVVYAPEYLEKLSAIIKENMKTDSGKMCVCCLNVVCHELSLAIF